jgi:hypothetical protein
MPLESTVKIRALELTFYVVKAHKWFAMLLGK